MKIIVVKRMMRGKNPKIYIPYFRGSRDEDYLRNAMRDINSKYIKTYEINWI